MKISSWDWLPLAFYDLIARLVPGIVVMWLAGLTRLGCEVVGIKPALPIPGDNSFQLGFALLVAAYVIGIVAGQPVRIAREISGWIQNKRPKVLAILKELWQNAKEPMRNTGQNATAKQKKNLRAALKLHETSVSWQADPTKQEFDSLTRYLMSTHLRIANSSESSIVTKLIAEERMGHAILGGVGLLGISNVLFIWFTTSSFPWPDSSGDYLLSGAFAILMFTGWYHSRRLHDAADARVSFAWLYLAKSNQLFREPKSD